VGQKGLRIRPALGLPLEDLAACKSSTPLFCAQRPVKEDRREGPLNRPSASPKGQSVGDRPDGPSEDKGDGLWKHISRDRETDRTPGHLARPCRGTVQRTALQTIQRVCLEVRRKRPVEADPSKRRSKRESRESLRSQAGSDEAPWPRFFPRAPCRGTVSRGRLEGLPRDRLLRTAPTRHRAEAVRRGPSRKSRRTRARASDPYQEPAKRTRPGRPFEGLLHGPPPKPMGPAKRGFKSDFMVITRPETTSCPIYFLAI
jgi:hypothetical protein